MLCVIHVHHYLQSYITIVLMCTHAIVAHYSSITEEYVYTYIDMRDQKCQNIAIGIKLRSYVYEWSYK